MGILIGNTCRIWTPFIQYLKQSEDPLAVIKSNPLDTYTEKSIHSMLTKNLIGIQYKIYFAHQKNSEGKFVVAMQKLAHISGLAEFDPESYLNIHPKYGPWIAMRAAVVVDKTFSAAQENVEDLAQNVEILFERANSIQANKRKQYSKEMANWKYWLACRDAIPVGKEYRYSEEQILYHYTHDITVLEKLVMKK